MSANASPVIYRRRKQQGLLVLCGSIDVFEALCLHEHARKALEDTESNAICVDLSHAERLDTSAMQILLALNRDCEVAHKQITYKHPPTNLLERAAGYGIRLV